MTTIIRIMADGLMIPIVGLALYALIWRVAHSDRYDRYTRIFMAGITSYLVAKIVASLWQPQTLRPFEKIGADAGALYLNNPGFPSDHALFAMFLTIAVWYGTRNRIITVILLIMTVLVCVGRVLALVHTPLDVVGGVAVALVGAVWYKTYAKDRLHKHLAKRTKK